MPGSDSTLRRTLLLGVAVLCLGLGGATTWPLWGQLGFAVLVLGLLVWQWQAPQRWPLTIMWQSGDRLQWQQAGLRGWHAGTLRAVRGNRWAVVLSVQQQHPTPRRCHWVLWRDQVDAPTWHALSQRRVLLGRHRPLDEA